MRSVSPDRPRGHEVLFVSSPSHATPAIDVVALGFARLDIAALTAPAIAGASAVIFNLDLSLPAERNAVRSAVAKLPKRPPLLFAVDRGTHFHLQATQANALHARAVIRRPLDRAAVDEALDELAVSFHRATEPLDRRPGGKSIAAAQEVIGASFAALSMGAPIELDAARAASQQLFAGIGDAGLHAWLDLVREHHAGTFQHCILVTGAVVAYAAYAGDLSAEERNTLPVAALLHDIGKAEIPNAILDKPGALTDAELAIVRRHPRIGADYLTSQSGLPAAIVDPVLHHHEFLDGSGYPDRLRGDQINRMTRILTVCDIYGALVEQRAYKPAKMQSEALYILLGMAQAGKVDMKIAQTLALALGAKLEAATEIAPIRRARA